MRYELATMSGSYLTLSYEHATVGDAMRAGVFTCEPGDSLRTVARIMATQHVHCVLVSSDAQPLAGLVTGLDLLKAAAAGTIDTAAEAASSPLVTAEPAEPLRAAVTRMAAANATHAIVVRDGQPVGVLSAADVAGIIAWGEA